MSIFLFCSTQEKNAFDKKEKEKFIHTSLHQSSCKKVKANLGKTFYSVVARLVMYIQVMYNDSLDIYAWFRIVRFLLSIQQYDL